MPVDRKIYKRPFNKQDPPQWNCPNCGNLLKGNSGSFSYQETADSISAHKHEDWDPEWTQYTYSCQFSCTNPYCKETVQSVGTGELELVPDFDSDGQCVGMVGCNYFHPKFFLPHLNIFKIPEDTPEEVQDLIKESFKLFFVNPASSLNHLRGSLEKLLDHLKIKKTQSNKKRERRPLKLGERIKILPSKYGDLEELFSAIKWSGNSGSHPGEVIIDDVMDAYDIFEHVLEELFNRKISEVKKLAKEINKKRGVRKSNKKAKIPPP